MRKLLTFLKMQNPRRAGQGSAGGWLEASSWTRCQPKDPLNPSAPSKFPQARSLGNILALCTTCAWIALTRFFAVGSPAAADSCSRAFGYQGGNGCNSAIAAPSGLHGPRKLRQQRRRHTNTRYFNNRGYGSAVFGLTQFGK
jgi:hypothetical protein